MGNLDYLLNAGEPWLQYAVRLNLRGESKSALAGLEVIALQDHKIQALLKDIANFHATVVSNHKDPGLPIHKLLFLLELGFDRTVPEIRRAVDVILEHQDENGVFQSLVNVPKHFGGSGENAFGWALCDAPLLLYALSKAGVDYETHLKQGIRYLASLFQNCGFPCTVSRELGKFRGPGRKDDCCPYATLIMLKLFSVLPEYKDSTLAVTTIEVLLSLWENSLLLHPYMFYMGTDFRKLKAPASWYDIVSVADVLSRFDRAKRDPRFADILSIVKSKQDKDGMFTPESVYQKFGSWDFGQKKSPSPYLTYLCQRIFQRVGA